MKPPERFKREERFMAHYDLYRSLGLDRQASTADLARDLDDRLSAVDSGSADSADSADNAGAVEELSTARAILGDETRRGLYDQRLNDPSAPEIDIDSLRELAVLDTGGSGKGQQFQQQAGQFAKTAGAKTSAASHQVKDSFKQSKGLAIGVTAVVTAAVVLLGGWGIGKLVGGDDTPDYSDAQDTVNTFLEKNSEDDLRDWLQDNTVHQTRDDVMYTMGVDGDSSDDFNGMDSFFDANSVEAGTGVSLEQQAFFFGGDMDETYDEFEDEGFSRKEVDSMTVIGVKDSSDNYKGQVSLIKSDDDYKIMEVFAFDASDDSDYE